MNGARRTDERATDVWQRLQADYIPPPIPADVVAAMTGFVGRRITQGGAAPD